MRPAGETFVVRLPELDDYRVPGAQPSGVLSEIQRLDLMNAQVVMTHVRKHGAGLVYSIADCFDQDHHFVFIESGRPARFLADYIERQVLDQPSAAQVQALSVIWPEVQTTNLEQLHRSNVDRLVMNLESAVKVGASIGVSLTLASSNGHAPNPVVVTDRRNRLQPYLRARIEGTLALSADGPGMSRCDYCGRFFVQSRRGARYSRFCPGYACADDHKRTQYETSDYRREYKRRQLALRRLRARPEITTTAIKRAEREFETWKATAKERKRNG